MARWWRRGGSDSGPPPASSATGSGGPAPAPAPVQRAAWQDLPPIRPVVTGTPPIAPLDSFDGVPGHPARPELPGAAGAPGGSGRPERARRRTGETRCAADHFRRSGAPGRAARAFGAVGQARCAAGYRAIDQDVGSPAPRAGRGSNCQPDGRCPAAPAVVDSPPAARHLPVVAEPPATSSFVSAPDPGIRAEMPVVARPSVPSSLPGSGADGVQKCRHPGRSLP